MPSELKIFGRATKIKLVPAVSSPSTPEKTKTVGILYKNRRVSKLKNLVIYFSYPNAHLAQVEIEEIKKKDLEKFKKEREKKIEKELSKLQFKQNNEVQALELKIENHKNQLIRERSNKIRELELKFKNKERELERQQRAERAGFERRINSKITPKILKEIESEKVK